MLADTMMPEVFERGGRYVGLATTAGFGLAWDHPGRVMPHRHGAAYSRGIETSASFGTPRSA
jgi:hypothetical protein